MVPPTYPFETTTIIGLSLFSHNYSSYSRYFFLNKLAGDAYSSPLLRVLAKFKKIIP